MPLKSHTDLPPGHWRYEQPDTHWKMHNAGAIGDAINEMVEHRRFNNLPRATRGECLEDLDAYTCQRLGNNPSWCVTIGEAQKKTIPAPGQLAANPAGAGSLLQSVANKVGIAKDWLGEDEVAVSDELAQARANVCINDCSDPTRYQHFHNKPSSFFGRITGAVAQAILDQRREKTNRGLKVENEDKLFTCDVCSCHLPLKIFTKMDVILKRTDPALLPKFPEWCWMKTENRRKNEALEINAVKTNE